MKSRDVMRAVFALSGVYDGILGLAFLIVPASLFALFKVTPPNHYGYVQFPAAILIIFALLFFEVAADPVRGRNLIPYGILLKVAYCGVVYAYWFTTGLPMMWKPFALIDTVFALVFLWAWMRVRAPQGS